MEAGRLATAQTILQQALSTHCALGLSPTGQTYFDKPKRQGKTAVPVYLGVNDQLLSLKYI